MSTTQRRPPPKVAIVSDTMVQSGGAERVVEALAEAFPEAPVFTILYDPARGPRAIESRIVQSWLSHVPAATKIAKALIPVYPNAVESFDLREYDVIISSHHTLAKGVLRTSEQTHICYCHTPMRSLWERPHEEVQRVPRVLRPIMKHVLTGLRSWDLDAASRVDQFVANSENTAARIMKHYRRESIVLYPPIDTQHFTPGGAVGDYYLVASRNVPYKRIDLAMLVAEQLGHRLVIVGDSTDRLANASRNITFMGKVSDSKLIQLMREARALIFPPHEDFGMTVLEMNACGRPVIAFARGGALETIIDGVTGIVFHEQSASSLANAIDRFESVSFDQTVIRRHAESFSKHRFTARIQQLVDEAVVLDSASAARERRLALVGM